MPLGDSIALGVGSTSLLQFGGYRYALYRKFLSLRLNLQFLGSVANAGGAFRQQLWSEGHPGFRIHEIWQPLDPRCDRCIETWRQFYGRPDVILLMAGTNDILGNIVHSAPYPGVLPGAADRLDALVRHLDKLYPGVHIVVAQVTPFQRASFNTAANSYNNALAEDFNSALPAIIARQVADGLHVTLVDMYHALNPDTDLADPIHPNDSGYQKMSEVWYEGLGRIYKMP